MSSVFVSPTAAQKLSGLSRSVFAEIVRLGRSCLTCLECRKKSEKSVAVGPVYCPVSDIIKGMENTKERLWTPGPWKLEYSDYGDEIWFGGEGCGMHTISQGEDHSGNGIAFLGGDAEDEQKALIMAANAQLMATAPELFEGLYELVTTMKSKWGEIEGVAESLAPFEAILAKAQGQA